MPEPISVPVVFVREPILLPGMVVPIELDDAARAAAPPPGMRPTCTIEASTP